MAGLLEGIRVIDCSVMNAGPIAASMMGDLGADVIKVEKPGTGDPVRGGVTAGRAFDMPGGRHVNFEALNRNKRGITLDLTKSKGRQIIYQMLEHADVFINNFRQGTVDQLGLGYETLSNLNPRLIYAAVSPWGPNGPDSDQAAYDLLGQARSGFMTAIGEPDMPPLIAAGAIVDQMTGTMLAYGILAAIIDRVKTGFGQQVDASLLGSMIWLQHLSISTSLMMSWEMPRQFRASMFNPLYCYYKCGDDKWLALGLRQSDQYWSDFCRVMGLEDLEEDPKFSTMKMRSSNSIELISILDARFVEKPRDQWADALRKAGILFSKVNTVPELASDPQVTANRYIVDYDHETLGKIKEVGVPIGLSHAPGSIYRAAPEFGEHTEDVLLNLGYSWENLDQLRNEGVI